MSRVEVLDLNVIVFQIGKQNFAFSLDNVKEIIKVPVITPVPLTKSYVAGLINLRGEVIPVLNLREKYKIDNITKSEDARIIVIEKNNVKIGILVDKVLNITNIEQSQLNECKITSLEEVKAIIKQKQDERLVTFIDTGKIFKEGFEFAIFQKIGLENSNLNEDEKKRKLSKQERYILLRISDQNYALNIANIQEIIRFVEFSSVPSDSNDILGIVNLRNEIIPIVNIQKFLKLKEQKIGEETKIIIANCAGTKFGFVVDKILSVVSADEEDIKPIPTVVNFENVFEGTIKIDDNLYIILDIQKLFERFSSSIRKEIENQGEEALEMVSTGGEKQIVLFDLNGQKFAIDIQRVKEINRIPTVVKVPNDKNYLKGIANLRGEVIAIVDLCTLLYGEETELGDFSRVIIVELKGEKYGILAKKVLSVLKVSEKDIIEIEQGFDDEQMKEKISSLDIRYIKSIIKQGEDLIIQIEPDIILEE